MKAQQKIPEYTIRAKLKGLYKNKKPRTAKTLNDQEELEIIQWIEGWSRIGHPITKNQLLDNVHWICVASKKPNKFIGDKPGRSWWGAFKDRHFDVTSMVPESVNYNHTKVSKEDIRKWYRDVKTDPCFKKYSLTTFTPDRIFNTDEIVTSRKTCSNVRNKYKYYE
ncbi:hypothetical protein TKK_0013957 [Trichogramma kaykai]